MHYLQLRVRRLGACLPMLTSARTIPLAGLRLQANPIVMDLSGVVPIRRKYRPLGRMVMILLLCMCLLTPWVMTSFSVPVIRVSPGQHLNRLETKFMVLFIIQMLLLLGVANSCGRALV